MKTLYRLMTLGLLTISLASCVNSGGTTSAANNGGTAESPAAPVVKKSSKEKVIEYFQSYGSYSDGSYLLGSSRSEVSDGYTFKYTVVESYTPKDDSFMLVGNTDVTKDSSTVSYMGAVGFNWGIFEEGTFITDVEAGSSKALFVLSNVTFESDAQLKSCTITLKESNFSSSFSTSTLLSSGKTAINSLNLAIRHFNSLGLPSLR